MRGLPFWVLETGCCCGLAFGMLGCGTGSAVPDDGVDSEAVVTIDTTGQAGTVGALAFGIHTSVYDNNLHSAGLPTLLRAAGVTTFRYPGGGYSDNYHWSTHTLVPSYGDPASLGYLAAGSDFGSYMSVVDSVGASLVMTVIPGAAE